MSRLWELTREPLLALRDVFRNPDLRRVQLAWAGSIMGQYAFSVALAVYAYEHGGAAAVGLVFVARMLPAAIVSPFAAIVADCGSRKRVMLACDLIRAGALAATAAIVLLDGPPVGVYALAVVVTVVMTVFHPAEAALLPSLARSPEELSVANVSSSSIESIGGFAGPAIGGFALAAFSIEAAFAFTAATFLWSALLVARISHDETPGATDAEEPEHASKRSEALAGFRTIATEPKLRVIVGLYAAQTMVAGSASVLVVVISLRLLDLGEAGVGYLNAACGLGGLAGAAVALMLVARRMIAGDFGLGLVLWGAPLIVIGLHPSPALALAMLAVVGVGNTLVDVSAMTLLQRSVPDAVLARVFGVVQSLFVGSAALGAVLTPLLISAFGIRATLIVVGLVLPLFAIALWSRLRAIDRGADVPLRQLELLGVIPIFAPLPAPILEGLARALREVRAEPGTDVVRAGEVGHNFFVVADGTAEALVDGEPVPLGPGASFGEIALLRDVPRTATVRARTDLVLYALDRGTFIAAVTGHAPSRDAADVVIGERLRPVRTGAVSV